MEPEMDGAAQAIAITSAARLSIKDLAGVLEQLPSGVVVADRRGRPLLANHAARRVLGDLVNTSRSLIEASVEAGLRDVRSGQRVSPETSVLARTLRGENLSAEEYTVPATADREPMRLRVSSLPLRNRRGAIIGAVSVFTEVGAELTAEEALRSSQRRFRLALEASHMGAWEYDIVNAQFTEWSPEMASLTGTPVEPLTTKSSIFDAFPVVHADDRQALEQAVRQALSDNADLQVETRIRHGPTNRMRWLQVKGRVDRDQGTGRPLSMTGFAMDITGQKEAEAARQAMAQGERLRALGEMASGIAHDLNQSLALISGYSDMARQELVRDVPELGRIQEMMEITARAALEGGEALRGLLSFVRSQEPLAVSERFQVGEILQDVARLTAPRWRDAPQAEGRPIQLEITAEADCWIIGSPAALREAITNLIFNAVDALPRGGAIHLVAFTDDEHVIIEVCDTGDGIPRDLQARVFDPFFSTKGDRGTGLGLSQVQSIVERHNGTIELHSIPNNGTTFRLVFPSAASAADSADQPAEKDVYEPERSVRILVVEDEEQLARMAWLVLTQRGHDVVVASTGEEAIDWLARERFELVISDLGLGSGKNGWDVAEVVRRQWPDCRFVLVTGWGAAIDPTEARKRGVEEVIAKPYRISELRRIADRVAGGPDDE